MEKVVALTGSVLNLPSAAMAVMIMADITTTVVVMVLLFLHHKHFGVRMSKKAEELECRFLFLGTMVLY
jgi:hypothetical protein